MRDIKFRAWYERAKEMFQVDVLAINEVTWDSSGTGVSLAYQPHMKIMQYTGEKDKHGTDIYESDFIEDEMRGFIGVVVFSEGKFVVEFENIHEDLAEWSSESIIGNIYENPDLLGRD